MVCLLGGPIGDWFRHLVQPNIWDGFTDDQQNVLTEGPFNIHPNRDAYTKEKRKAEALRKRRDGLKKFQQYRGVNSELGVRPPGHSSGNMKLSTEELSLGSSIAQDLR